MTDFVFLHGGGQGGWVWAETISALMAQTGRAHRCLALDGPGCGTKRGRDTSEIGFDAITNELIADIETAGMRDVVLVGHSQAGIHMPAMALVRPDLFARLIFVTTVAPDPGLTITDFVNWVMHKGNHPVADEAMPMRERYRAMFCNDMAEEAAESFLDKLGSDHWPSSCYMHSDWPYDHLVGFSVSYVLCEADAVLPLEWQERFAERCHARSTIRVDAGHQVMNTCPQALAEILLTEARA